MFAGRQQARLKNAISGTPLGTLIYQPSGSGEENIIHMTLSVIATTYLDKAILWESVGIDRRNEALQHIITGRLTQMHLLAQTAEILFKVLVYKI